VIRLPSRKSRRKFLARTKEWLSRHRHWKRRDQLRVPEILTPAFPEILAP